MAANSSQPPVSSKSSSALQPSIEEDQLRRAAQAIRALTARCAAAETRLAQAEAQHSAQQCVHSAAEAAAALSQAVVAAETAAAGLKAAKQPTKASAVASALAAAPLEHAKNAKKALEEAAAAATSALTSLEVSAAGDAGSSCAFLTTAAREELRSDLEVAHAVGAALSEAIRVARHPAPRGGSPVKRLRRLRDLKAGAYSAIDMDASGDSEEESFTVAPETGSSIMTPLRAHHSCKQSKSRSQQRGWLARVLHSELQAQNES